jgi:hypothetical protein
MFLFAFFWIVPFLFLGALILGGVAVGTRREPDPSGRRVYAIYLMTVMFLSILAALVGVSGVGAKTVDLITYDSGATSGRGGDFSGGQENCTTAPDGSVSCTSTDVDMTGDFGFQSFELDRRTQDRSELLTYGVVLVVAVGLLVWHGARLNELKREGSISGVVRGTYAAYVYLMSFTALLIVVTAAVVIILSLGDVIFPSDLSGGPREYVRDDAYAQLVSSLLGGAAAFFVLRYHWGEGRRLREESVIPEPVLT